MSVATALKRSADATRLARMVGDDPTNSSREANDFYPTPEHATRALLRQENFAGPIWEPACGDGAISRVLEGAGHMVISSDLIDRGYGEGGQDFLLQWEPRAPNIITNPPFKLGAEFVRHALRLTTGKVAMLARLTFLESRARREMFNATPLARVHIFSERLTFQRGGEGKANGGMLAFAWFVWEHGYTGKPTLGWL